MRGNKNNNKKIKLNRTSDSQTTAKERKQMQREMKQSTDIKPSNKRNI